MNEPIARVVVLTAEQLEALLDQVTAQAALAVQTSSPQCGLRVSEVAERLSCAEFTVYGMIQRGEFPVIRLGSAIRVPESALEEWIRTQTAPLHQTLPAP